MPLAAVAACVALAAAAAAAEAPPSQSPIAEGAPQTALRSWTLMTDPANRGLARGWQRGGFGGRIVSVPNVVDPTHISGPAGTRNMEGSVAWYRATFMAPHAGTWALNFTSANFRVDVWVDGRAICSH